MACAEFVTHELMRKNRDLRQAMILQGEMIRQKDFVASQLTQVATENYELKLQNAKLWAVIEKQKKVLLSAQEEIEADKEEAESLIEELAAENEHLRSLLRISDGFHSADMLSKLSENIKAAESELYSCS